jgi:extracellular elastinolytic metalloproteinase
MFRLASALLALAVFVPAAASAHRRPGPTSDAAEPYFDARTAAQARALSAGHRGAASISSATRTARARLVRSLGPDAALDTNPVTGTARSLQQLDAPLTGASTADRAGLAWDYVRAHAAALGLDSGDLAGFDLASRELTDRGLLMLRWAQSYKGIPAFDNDVRVNVDKAGRIINVAGTPLHDLTLDSTAPALSPSEALDALMRNVGVTRNVRVTSGPSGTRQQTRFSTGDFARLVIFGGDGAPRLAWHVTYAATSVANYDAVVDASSGQVLYRQNLTKFASNASVWPNYPGAPSGGTAGTVDLTSYLAPAATELTGPNAHAWSDVNDNDTEQLSEAVGHSSGTDFTYPVSNFNATATNGGCSATAICTWDGDLTGSGALQNAGSWQTNRKQNAVQAFWFVNNFHDHLASAPIGFTSPDNFEGDDPVLINADDGAALAGGGPDVNHIDNANMTTHPVGTSPKMQMYLFNNNPALAPFRDVNGGDAAVVVYHENTHGLSNRLITNDDGTGAVSSPEAGAMGEAWSDWYAQDFVVRQGFETDTIAPGEIDMGKYTDAQPNTIRTQPLDCPVGVQGVPACAGGATGDAGGYTFGDFGHVVGSPEVHSDGEIWGETLWDLRTALITATGDEQNGSDLAEQLITDGMRLSPPEPSYLDERNAILGAVDLLPAGQQDAARDAIWSVFRNRGMGFFAGAADGSDVAPVEDFSPPPDPSGPKGTISGTVTSADTGLPAAGVTVGIGGHAKDPDAGNVLAATTDSSGRYTISNVPAGTYRKLVAYAATGFDQVVSANVQVGGGQTATQDFAIRRDWASLSGGATVAVSDDSGADFGCGGDQLIDQNEGVGWSPFNPSSTDPGNPHAGNPTATVHLPQTITVRAFLADPGNTCGDDDSATTKGYRIETSPDGTHWTIAVQGNFASADAHRLNTVTPTAGTQNVRFVRLTLLSPQNACGSCSGADFIDFSELEVLGASPNVLPSGSLSATPSTVAQGGTVHFDASSFHDPDSVITGYSWDFDGNGTVDRTTGGPTTDFAYASAGTFGPRVTANDFEGGGGSAATTVVVKAPGGTTPPPPPAAGPSVTISSRGSGGKLRITIKCATACRATGRATISSSLRRKLHLKSRTVATLSARLTTAGTRRLDLKLSSRVRSAMRRHHVRSLRISVRIVAKDANGKSKTARRTATVKR